jgi:hypothetical protein
MGSKKRGGPPVLLRAGQLQLEPFSPYINTAGRRPVGMNATRGEMANEESKLNDYRTVTDAKS